MIVVAVIVVAATVGGVFGSISNRIHDNLIKRSLGRQHAPSIRHGGQTKVDNRTIIGRQSIVPCLRVGDRGDRRCPSFEGRLVDFD